MDSLNFNSVETLPGFEARAAFTDTFFRTNTWRQRLIIGRCLGCINFRVGGILRRAVFAWEERGSGGLVGDGVEIPFAVFAGEDDVVVEDSVPAAVEMNGVELHFVPHLVVDVVGAFVVGDYRHFGGEGVGGEQ